MNTDRRAAQRNSRLTAARRDDLVMQFQADLCGIDVGREVIERPPWVPHTPPAWRGGLGHRGRCGQPSWQEGKRWTPSMEPTERIRTYRLWKKAVTRTLDWVDDDVK